MCPISPHSDMPSPLSYVPIADHCALIRVEYALNGTEAAGIPEVYESYRIEDQVKDDN